MFEHLSLAWRQCIEAFLQTNPSPTSRQRFRSTLSCFVRELGKPLDEVTAGDIEAFVASLSRQRNHGHQSTKNTQRRRLHIVTAFYRFASTYQVNGQPLYQNAVPHVEDLQMKQPTRDTTNAFSHLPVAWQQCIEVFVQSVESRSGSTASRTLYVNTLARFFADSAKSPAAYTQTDVRAFLASKSTSRRNPGADVAPNTRNSRLQVLNSLYKFAATYEIDGQALLTSKAPSYGISYLKIGAQYRALSIEEIERILNAIPANTEKGSRDRALTIFYFFTGLRRQEALRLTWGDLEHVIIVDPDGTRRPGVSFSCRRKGRSREIQHRELPQSAWCALRQYLKISGRYEHMQAGDWLFTSSRQYKGTKPLDQHHVNRMFKEACARAGLDASKISLHCLRHAGGRARYLAGQDIISLKNWLDHSSLETTYRYIQAISSTSDSFALQLEQQFAFLTRS